LNRIDATIIFQPLAREEIASIVGLQLEAVSRRLQEKHITIASTPALEKLIATLGYDPVFGARPLKRVISERVLDPLSMEIIEGHIGEGDGVLIDVKDGGVVITKKKKQTKEK
jgi:ATP-dependent Clp protease ATP-binding subunit ClpB